MGSLRGQRRMISGRRPVATYVGALACLAVAGCAGFWDDVTSRDFKFKSAFSKPNPFLVLQESQDGDKRARALRALREPKRSGGTDQDQDAVVKILTTAAVAERQFLPRLAAIESLGRFEDARAVHGLTDAYQAAASFTPELCNRLQCAALTSLGETGSAAAVPFLARVLERPAPDGSDPEKQQIQDLRIAAARALGQFKDFAATEALVRVLRRDKDVALCDCAYVSLQANMDRVIPPDFKDWDKLLAESRARQADPNRDAPKPAILAWLADLTPTPP